MSTETQRTPSNTNGGVGGSSGNNPSGNSSTSKQHNSQPVTSEKSASSRQPTSLLLRNVISSSSAAATTTTTQQQQTPPPTALRTDEIEVQVAGQKGNGPNNTKNNLKVCFSFGFLIPYLHFTQSNFAAISFFFSLRDVSNRSLYL